MTSILPRRPWRPKVPGRPFPPSGSGQHAVADGAYRTYRQYHGPALPPWLALLTAGLPLGSFSTMVVAGRDAPDVQAFFAVLLLLSGVFSAVVLLAREIDPRIDSNHRDIERIILGVPAALGFRFGWAGQEDGSAVVVLRDAASEEVVLVHPVLEGGWLDRLGDRPTAYAEEVATVMRRMAQFHVATGAFTRPPVIGSRQPVIKAVSHDEYSVLVPAGDHAGPVHRVRSPGLESPARDSTVACWTVWVEQQDREEAQRLQEAERRERDAARAAEAAVHHALQERADRALQEELQRRRAYLRRTGLDRPGTDT